MTYSVKEIYYTLQGEGAQSGRPAVFCRFAGCNLWSGLEADRAEAACTFCDTDFIGTDGENGGKFTTAEELADKIAALWPDKDALADAYVVFTGGEPLLQLDTTLLEACKALGFETAVETNGTQIAPANLDWICVSPKPNSAIVQNRGHELKFVYPQDTLSPYEFADYDFEHFFIQPMEVEDEEAYHHNIQASIVFCLQNPQWRLSLQTHKIIGIS
jgi:7-carboxy-7-deazaguanine synthase (Cx14CxxC type)